MKKLVVMVVINCLDFTVSVNLEQEQVAHVTLKAKRINENNKYSDLILNGKENISSMDKPYCDFTESVANEFINSGHSIDKDVDFTESAVTVNSLLILFWKVNSRDSMCGMCCKTGFNL